MFKLGLSSLKKLPLNEAKVKVMAMGSVSTTIKSLPKIAVTVKVSSLLRAWH